MATKKKASIPVPGYGELATALKGKMQFIKQLEGEVKAGKTTLNAAVQQLLLSGSIAEDASSFAFVDDKGLPTIKVAVPDAALDGNRLSVSPESRSKLLVDLNSLGEEDFETNTSYVLSGPWAAWLQQMQKQWAEQGVKMPEDGIVEKVVTKIKPSGLDKLRALAKDGVERAQEALSSLIKAASVTVAK